MTSSTQSVEHGTNDRDGEVVDWTDLGQRMWSFPHRS